MATAPKSLGLLDYLATAPKLWFVLSFILFIAYLALFAWLIFRQTWFRKMGLPGYWVLSLFVSKVAAGAAYAWLFSQQPQYEVRIDTWRYFYQSLPEKDWLITNPGQFFADLFLPRYANDQGLLATQNSLLNDLKEVLVIKLAAIFNVFSGGRYYVNLIFFNYIVLFGQVAIGVLWCKCFNLKQTKWLVAGLVLWPSVLFWSSGFHRDGLMLHCLGMVLWSGYQVFSGQKRRGWALAVGILHVGLLFLLRHYLAGLLLVAGCIGWLVYRFPRWATWWVPACLLLGLLVLVGVGIRHPSLSLPQLLATRQQEFLGLEGQSKVAPLPLNEGWVAMGKALPQALTRAFARPLPAAGLSLTEWLAALENLLWLLGIAPALWVCRKFWTHPSQKAWWATVGLLVLGTALITGYTIPFIGAIARYKVLWWPFMIAPVLYAAGQMLTRRFTVLRRL
jgi:hypothetical protein